MSDAVFNTTSTDVVIPANYAAYIQQLSEQKSALVRSGALQANGALDRFLAGGGNTINLPSWQDLDQDAAAIATSATADFFAHRLNGTSIDLTGVSALSDIRPKALNTGREIAVRLSRAQAWGYSNLAEVLAGSDPAGVLADRISDYWVRQRQLAFIATMNGVSKDNGANDSGDYAYSVVTGGYEAGVSDFQAEHVLNAAQTLGDSQGNLSLLMVHSVVFTRMKINNLIDFIPDSINPAMRIATFLGMFEVIVDDGMNTGTSVVLADGRAGSAGMYESWLFGRGAMQYGTGTPPNAFEQGRQPQAGQGFGQDVVYSRVSWCMHPRGHAYIGTSPEGGPSNGTSTHDLNIATSWNRVYPERKQIPFARLITMESAS